NEPLQRGYAVLLISRSSMRNHEVSVIIWCDGGGFSVTGRPVARDVLTRATRSPAEPREPPNQLVPSQRGSQATAGCCPRSLHWGRRRGPRQRSRPPAQS